MAGTATVVAGGVSRHQAGKQQQAADAAAYEQQQQMAAAAPPQQVVYQTAPPADTGVSDDTVAQLERLGKLKQEGILTDEEFAAQKAKLLGG